MIELRLKRTGENKSVTFGEFRIPKVGFGCKTLELKDGSHLMCKQSCRIPEGSYICEMKMNKVGIFCPHIKYKVKGFAVKPEFDFINNHFNNLPTGFIALGTGYPDAYSITQSAELNQALSNVCRELFYRANSESVVLNVYKVVNYNVTDEDYQDELLSRSFNFLGGVEDETDSELPPLEHDHIDG